MPARPGRADVDPLLAEPGCAGSSSPAPTPTSPPCSCACCAATGCDVELAYVPADRRSAAARLWGLPHGPAAVELARTGGARPAPLVRDDAGGVLVGPRGDPRRAGGARRGLLRRGAGAARGGAAAGGDAPAGRGAVARRDRRARAPGVAVRASRWGALPDGRLRPVPPAARAGRGAAVGRAVQVGCLPATVVHDGVAHPRPVTRWAWYRHVADWLLVRP